jgi:hypothetical protein
VDYKGFSETFAGAIAITHTLLFSLGQTVIETNIFIINKKNMSTNSLSQTKSGMFLKKIQEMQESSFTFEVVMPLFSALGFSVDHHGGQFEGGKDVICWRNADFGVRELVVIQVKKTKSSAAAKSKNSFSEIITQLQQASEKSVPCLDGISRRPDKIYFITPYQIDTRSLESRFEGMSTLTSRGVKVLDGVAVYEQLVRTLPNLIEDVCGDEFSIKHGLLAKNVSNADLLSALNYSNEKSIEDFYCDLDFSVGRLTSKLFFAFDFNGKNEVHNFDAIAWAKLQKITDRIFNQTKVDIIQPSTTIVIEEYRQRLIDWESPKNKAFLNNAFQATSEIENTLRFVISECSELVNDALFSSSENTPFGQRTSRAFTESELNRLDTLKQAKQHLQSQYTSWLDNAEMNSKKLVQTKKILDAATFQLERMRNEGFIVNVAESGRLNQLLRSVRSMNKQYEELAKIAPEIRRKPDYRISIDGLTLERLLKDWRNFVADGIDSLSKKKLSLIQTREFFEQCQLIFSTVGEIMDFHALAEAVGIDGNQKYSVDLAVRRIHMPMREVFATGIDCAVYGEAGAGKSTTLFKYASEASSADEADEITLFLPLTRLLANHRIVGDNETIAPLEKLETEIATFLNTKKNISNEEVLSFLNKKRRVVFIFDGVDEVIKTAPWIVDAIQALRNAYKNSQVILSARSSGRYLDNTTYLGLTILPFSDQQVESFVRGWFKSQQDIADDVLAHLVATTTLAEIVRNPLLATVLCVLAENKVPLPAGELSLYAERMKLLLGHYDIHKKSKRLVTHHVVLEAIARKIAFQLHSLGIRSAAPGSLEEIAVKALKNQKFEGIKEAEIRTAVRELIEPSNILVPMTDEGDMGFGHLRFQEYLCASELCQNRGVDILPLLKSPWWKSAIVLFSRLTDDIEHIINQALEREVNISKCRDTLLAVIETRSGPERYELKRLIDRHSKLDHLAEELMEYEDYEYGGYEY